MILVISFLIYLGLELTPGDAVSYMLPPDALMNIKPAEFEQIRESLGLNQPFIVRYFLWLGDVMQGNFGYSLASGVPIKDIVLDRLHATLELSISALILSSILGVIFGTISALNRGSLTDNFFTVFGVERVDLFVP